MKDNNTDKKYNDFTAHVKDINNNPTDEETIQQDVKSLKDILGTIDTRSMEFVLDHVDTELKLIEVKLNVKVSSILSRDLMII